MRNRRPVFLDFHQPVLGIISQVEGVRADGAGDLVAIGVVGVVVQRSSIRCQAGYSMGMGRVGVGQGGAAFGFQVAAGGVVGIGFRRIIGRLLTDEAYLHDTVTQCRLPNHIHSRDFGPQDKTVESDYFGAMVKMDALVCLEFLVK